MFLLNQDCAILYLLLKCVVITIRGKSMKKTKIVLALASALMLAGCSGPEVKEQDENVTLSLMMPQSHYKDFFKDEVSRFEKEYPQYHIDVLRIPDNQWIEVVKTKAVTGELTDLIRIDKSLMADVGAEKFVEMGEEESWYSRVKEEQLENKKINGKLYGLPVGSSSSVGLIYNKGIFEELQTSVPQSMDELYSVCGRLRDAGYIPVYASDKDSWTATIGFTASVSQIMTDEDYEKVSSGEMSWNNEEYRKILDEFAALRTQGYTNDNYIEATYDSAVQAMAAGNTAMYMSGQFFINDVQELAPDIELGMVPVPYRGDILTVKSGEGMFAVSAQSSHVEEAKVFLDWFSQPDNMNEFNAGWNHMPVFKDQVMDMPDWQQELYDQYIEPGKTALEINERFSGTDMSELWNLQQERFMGDISSEEVLEGWQESFDQQRDGK